MTTDTEYRSSFTAASVGCNEMSSAMRPSSIGGSEYFLPAPHRLVSGEPIPCGAQALGQSRWSGVIERFARLGNVAPGRMHLALAHRLAPERELAADHGLHSP